MAIIIREVMNPALFTVTPSDPVDDTLATLIALGLSAAPVVDGAGRPIGLVSWRELARARDGRTVGSRMSAPATSLRAGESLERAARLLVSTGFHHAPVVDDTGVVVGFVSLVDLVRGLLGLPSVHPAGLVHIDEETGAAWSDPRELTLETLDAAPEGAGVLVLIHGGRGVPETLVWAEASEHLRARLLDVLSEPQRQPLAHWLDTELRFRVAAIADAEARERVAELLRARARHASWPEHISH